MFIHMSSCIWYQKVSRLYDYLSTKYVTTRVLTLNSRLYIDNVVDHPLWVTCASWRVSLHGHVTEFLLRGIQMLYMWLVHTFKILMSACILVILLRKFSYIWNFYLLQTLRCIKVWTVLLYLIIILIEINVFFEMNIKIPWHVDRQSARSILIVITRCM